MMIYLLHISDLHLVADPEWYNMKNAILNAAEERMKDIPVGQKLLVITGDFHNFSANNFDHAKEFVTSLAEKMGIEMEKDVFAVPGNHDVSKTIPEEIDREALLLAIKTKPEMLYKNNRIKTLLECYDGYTEFVKEIGIYPEESGLNPVSVHVRTWRNRLNLLHLNTTIIADGSQKNGQMTDARTAASEQVRKDLGYGELPRIAIGHNSFYDLAENQRNILAGMFLQEKVSAYLCGDRHQKNTKREEKHIILGEEESGDSVTIPNVVSYRTSADENDTYSDFGMIWHKWDEETGKIQMEYFRWNPEDQAKLQPDGTDSYSLRPISEKPKADPALEKENKTTDDRNNCWFSNADLSAKGNGGVKPGFVRNFLLGGRCRWELAFSEGWIVERKIVEGLYEKAVNGGVYVLIGPGGEGKTTVLMQMCAKLIRNGQNVFYYRGYGLSALPENIPQNAVFVMDNPPDTPKFKRFLESVIEEGVTLIIGERENEWNLLKKTLGIPGRDIQEVSMGQLDKKESWAFADCVCENLLHSRERKEIKEVFYTNSYGFLYAAMLLAVKDTNSLEDIAHEIIMNLSRKSREGLILLGHIVLAERYGVKFTRENFREVCGKLQISPWDGNKALGREAGLNGENYQTRHEVISELFYKELFSDCGVLSQEETDRILTRLLEQRFQKYSIAYGYLKNRAADEIMKLCGGFALAGLETRRYLISRMLDEIKSQPPTYFHEIPLYIKDEEIQLLFFRQCFDREWISDEFLKLWCDLLSKRGVPWDAEEAYSPAWILRKVCLEQGGDSIAWLMWAKQEEQENGAGEYGRENTARWIYREACLKHRADSHTWLAWGQLEERQNNVGGLDYKTENTARWIYQEACMNHSGNGAVWRAWGQLEEHQNNIGGLDYKIENTARWIYREACLKHQADSHTWLAWGQLEECQNNVGGQDYKTENTARWIYWEACLKYQADSHIWLAWGQLEERQNNVGGLDYKTENTARWIYREACLKYQADSHIWLAWGQLEERQNNVGELDYKTENTARWIYQEACLNHSGNGALWLAWGRLEERQNNVGGQDYKTENTARWIYREACLKHGGDGSVWLAWARLEEKENNIGECWKENTARWIFQNGIERFPDVAVLYWPYAHLELMARCPDRARSILRQAAKYSDYSLGDLAILEFYYNNIDTDSEYSMNQLMKRMENQKEFSFGAVQSLYYCSRLLGRDEDVERYYQLLQQHPQYDPENTSVEEVIDLCRQVMAERYNIIDICS